MQPSQPRCLTAWSTLAAACLLTACAGGSNPPRPAEPELPRNESSEAPATADLGRRELARCFQLDRARFEEALSSGLVASARLRWIAGGEVPGLDMGEAWPGVAVSDLRTGSIYQQMGLVDGDIVYAIDGFSLHGFDLLVDMLAAPEAAELMSDFSLLAGALPDALSLAVVRDGGPITLTAVFGEAWSEACRPPRLDEEEAEQRTWTDSEWQAHYAAEEEAWERKRARDEERARTIAGISKVGATSFEIDPSVFEVDTTLLSRGARIVPAITNGKQDGVKLYAVRPSSIYSALGIANGDKLRAVNGITPTSPEHLIELLGRLGDTTKFSITLERRGQPLTLDYTIR